MPQKYNQYVYLLWYVKAKGEFVKEIIFNLLISSMLSKIFDDKM